MKRPVFWLCFLLLLVLGRPVLAAEVAAEIVFAAGDVSIESGGQKRAATRGGEIKSGELVETGADGRVQLRFRDGATMSLLPSTRFRVDEYRFSGGSAAAEDKGFFSLVKGGFRTVSGLIGKQFRQQYRVTTPVATIGIRGTAYSANLGPSGLRVQTTQGVVEICTNAGCTPIPVASIGIARSLGEAVEVAPSSPDSGGGRDWPALEAPTTVNTPGTVPVESPAAPASPGKSPSPPPESPPVGAGRYPGYGR